MRRRYEDVSNLVQYQLKTNQQGNIEVYVDDRFVGNVSEGVCNWKDIEYKQSKSQSFSGGSRDYVTSVSDFPSVTGPGNDSVEFEGEGRLIVETKASHYEIEVS